MHQNDFFTHGASQFLTMSADLSISLGGGGADRLLYVALSKVTYVITPLSGSVWKAIFQGTHFGKQLSSCLW